VRGNRSSSRRAGARTGRPLAAAALCGAAVFLLAACGGDDVTQPGPDVHLVFSGSAATGPGGLVGYFGIYNAGRAELVGAYAGVCMPSLLVSASETSTGEPLWDQQQWLDRQPGGCTPAAVPLRIPPG
jgi:hypothetical protein